MTDKEQKEIFTRNLLKYLSRNNKSQKEVANAIGVSPQTFNTWCQGIALPRMGKVQRLADYFGINKSDLIDDNTIPSSSIRKCVRIPVLGRVAAGIPLTAVEEIVDEEEITEEMAKHGEFFGLVIKGDSMAPRICNGDVVIVRKQEDAESGDIVIALINGEDGVCKRLQKYADAIVLISNNPDFAPMIFSKEDIEKKPVQIIGKVVELRAKMG